MFKAKSIQVRILKLITTESSLKMHGEFLTVFLLSSVTVTPRHQQIPTPVQQNITDYKPGYQFSTSTSSCCLSHCSPEHCFTGFTKDDEIQIHCSSFQLLKLENLLRWSFFTLIYHCSWHMNYFIYTSQQFTPLGRYELKKLTSLQCVAS